MKCPKCGYLGFETTDRCRNCQYDFSLTTQSADTELTLHGADRAEARIDALDLDRLFGDPVSSTSSLRSEPSIEILDNEADAAALSVDVEPPVDLVEPVELEPVEPIELLEPAVDALPFDDSPIVPPPAARPPLAVRRATPEVPRNRPRTTRPIKHTPLELEPDTPLHAATARVSASETVSALMETPALGARVGAGLIDTVLLGGIDLVILYLTLRVAGLNNTFDDVRILPAVPFGGFLALLAFGYVAAFTVAGGQTIGKMIMSLRVIGDDGRPIDAAGGALRAAGCMLVPLTLGLSYVPALVTSDHRALHDRLAGTRVVRE